MNRIYFENRVSRVLAIILIIFAFITIIPGIGVWSIVGAGHVGVVTRFGAVNRVVNPGFIIKLPLIEGVSSMETRTQKEQVEETPSITCGMHLPEPYFPALPYSAFFALFRGYSHFRIQG